MQFDERELSQHRKLVEDFIERRRPPEHLRDKVDLAFRIENQNIFIFERRAVQVHLNEAER